MKNPIRKKVKRQKIKTIKDVYTVIEQMASELTGLSIFDLRKAKMDFDHGAIVRWKNKFDTYGIDSYGLYWEDGNSIFEYKTRYSIVSIEDYINRKENKTR